MELAGTGIKSRAYKPGPYSTCENLPHAFDQMVLKRERKAKARRPEDLDCTDTDCR